MIDLAIIADDLTGALDTGVQFSRKGAEVSLLPMHRLSPENLASRGGVLVLDSEIRHARPEDAYARVLSLARSLRDAGVSMLYIKTDSGLRGNIGAAITAALHATGAAFLPFIPAFPAMRRITRGGVHYVDGLPIDQSVFGRDPFTPVRSSHVKDLFAGMDVPVTNIPRGAAFAAEKGVGIYDAETEADLRDIGGKLLAQGVQVFAGCAGFAAVLAERLPPARRARIFSPPRKPLLVISGSLSPITQRQIEYGAMRGWPRRSLSSEQLLEDHWPDSAGGRRWLDDFAALLEGEAPVLLDTGEGISRDGAEKEILRQRIARRPGQILRRLLERDALQNRIPLIIGGDTLLGCMEALEGQELLPLWELEPGVVLSLLRRAGETLWLISKSGGFGEADVLERIISRLEEGIQYDKLRA